VDIGLPGADGYEVFRRVRASLKLVAITGYGLPEDKAPPDRSRTPGDPHPALIIFKPEMHFC